MVPCMSDLVDKKIQRFGASLIGTIFSHNLESVCGSTLFKDNLDPDRVSTSFFFLLNITYLLYTEGDSTEAYIQKTRKVGSGIIKCKPITGGGGGGAGCETR